MGPSSMLANSLPRRRSGGLVVRRLKNETVVYDVDRHEAHCLNATASRVWQHCDGYTSLPQITHALEVELGLPPEACAVDMAIDQLGQAHLLEFDVPIRAGVDGGR